ncbi:MAG: hypothetical protein ACK40O_03000 [Allosphingosinicella sp.]
MGIFRKLVAGLLFAAAAGVFHAAPASAQATRTWVSGVGDDVNPCSRTAPCKTFAGAISKTAAGGEINCMDPGGFGAVTITKSITIDCADSLGSTLASGTNGFIINGAGINVTLRNLFVNGGTPALPGLNGIRFLQGATLHVQNVAIFNFTAASPNGFGIQIAPSAGLSEIYITDSYISNNGAPAAGGGIEVKPTGSGSAQVMIRNVRVTNSGSNGFRSDTTTTSGTIVASIEDSEFSGNGQGIAAVTGGAGSPASVVMVNGSASVNNTNFGIIANGASAVIRVGDTSITGNGTGVQIAGSGQVQSFGDNRLQGNASNGAFSSTIGKN